MDDKDRTVQLDSPLNDRDLRRMSRRELLKLTPILGVGALALPPFNERLLKYGLRLTDRASSAVFNRGRLAQIFSDSEVTPLEKFPVNSYSDYNPENDLGDWTLTVEGMVARPGQYSLDQIKSLPRQRQNVKHICEDGGNNNEQNDPKRRLDAGQNARCMRLRAHSRGRHIGGL